MAAYSAAKAGVVALSRALALEEARCGITVNVVSPGLLKDESGDKAAAAADAMLGDRVPGRATPAARPTWSAPCCSSPRRPPTSSPARWSRWRAAARL